jgi:N-carbamoyl-L-amino-acid hydrolase
VVPGEVQLTVEMRDLSSAKIARLAEELRGRAQSIAQATGTQIEMRRGAHHDEALATPEVQASIEAVCKRMNLASRRLPSGAGHDAQMMATLGRMGMIFVPSVGGISHSPKELTTWEDCARGASVLLETVLEWAK